MVLKAVAVEDNSKEYQDFISLYYTAFPPDELIPEDYFQKCIHLNGASVTAYYSGEIFVGFTYVIDTEQFLFLYFFAVNPELRSRGFGSEIIRNHLMKKYPGKPIVLNAEAPDDTTEDNTSRLRRIAFYERLGFSQMNCKLFDGRVLFMPLSTSEKFNLNDLVEFMQELYDFQQLGDTIYMVRNTDEFFQIQLI